MPRIQVADLGQREYAPTWTLQHELQQAVIAQKLAARDTPSAQAEPPANWLLLVEHPPVYTLGKSGKSEHLLATEAELAALGATYLPIDRGGDITYHGPGQLVAYPLFDLEQFGTDLSKYLRRLEQAVINVLAEYGLAGERLEGLTGVWLDAHGPHPRKICAMGIRCSRWVTMHGLALNVSTDLSFFQRIVPCGIADADKGVTSISHELGRHVTLADVKPRLVHHLAEVFEASCVTAALPEPVGAL